MTESDLEAIVADDTIHSAVQACAARALQDSRFMTKIDRDQVNVPNYCNGVTVHMSYYAGLLVGVLLTVVPWPWTLLVVLGGALMAVRAGRAMK